MTVGRALMSSRRRVDRPVVSRRSVQWFGSSPSVRGRSPTCARSSPKVLQARDPSRSRPRRVVVLGALVPARAGRERDARARLRRPTSIRQTLSPLEIRLGRSTSSGVLIEAGPELAVALLAVDRPRMAPSATMTSPTPPRLAAVLEDARCAAVLVDAEATPIRDDSSSRSGARAWDGAGRTRRRRSASGGATARVRTPLGRVFSKRRAADSDPETLRAYFSRPRTGRPKGCLDAAALAHYCEAKNAAHGVSAVRRANDRVEYWRSERLCDFRDVGGGGAPDATASHADVFDDTPGACLRGVRADATSPPRRHARTVPAGHSAPTVFRSRARTLA